MSAQPLGFRLRELAGHVNARLVGDGELIVTSIATLQDAGPGQLSFLANRKYRRYLDSTRAAAVIVSPHDAAGYSGNALVVNNPYDAYARLTALFAGDGSNRPGVHPSAVLADDVQLGADVMVGPHVSIGSGTQLGDGTRVGPGSQLGANCRIGRDCRIQANVSVYDGVQIGHRCIFHSSVVIGSDGFGFAPHDQGWTKIHHLAGVNIGDDVELGAGTCVDRGALSDTVIDNGVKVDNLVQIAHGVRIGEGTVIAGCTAIAGSTEIGSRCVIAGKVGIVGHLSITDGVTVTAMTLVTKSIHEPGSYSSGTPMSSSAEWRRQAARFAQLDDISRRLKKLENGDT